MSQDSKKIFFFKKRYSSSPDKEQLEGLIRSVLGGKNPSQKKVPQKLKRFVFRIKHPKNPSQERVVKIKLSSIKAAHQNPSALRLKALKSYKSPSLQKKAFKALFHTKSNK